MNQVTWKEPEFDYYPKNYKWYVSVIIFFILMLIFAWWQKNILFFIFSVIALILVLYLEKKKPQLIEFKLDSEKLTIGEKEYLLKNFKKFFIRDSKELLLMKKTGIKMKIPIKKDLASQIKQILTARKIKFEPMEESLLDTILEKLGF